MAVPADPEKEGEDTELTLTDTSPHAGIPEPIETIKVKTHVVEKDEPKKKAAKSKSKAKKKGKGKGKKKS